MRASTKKRQRSDFKARQQKPVFRTADVVASELAARTQALHGCFQASRKEDHRTLRRWLSKCQERLQAVLFHASKNQTDRESLNDELPRFEDMMAQTIAYSLYVARIKTACSLDFESNAISIAVSLAPAPLNEILRDIKDERAPKDVRPYVDEMIWALARVSVPELQEDFRSRPGYHDPLLHFYEMFLASYSPETRKARGVYYTPQAVVDYLVDSVDSLLRNQLELPGGIDSRNVALLDPAVGTGAFLLGALNKVGGMAKPSLASRLFGFDILATACCATRLNISSAMTFAPGNGEARAASAESAATITLTRSLEESARMSTKLFENHEAIVVLGNPPYSGESSNHDQWMHDLLRGYDAISDQETESYFLSQGERLKEKNIKWLNDDYVKFMRFAQWQVERKGKGIVAFVTNNGYLDNPTFRGMRESLLKTFDEIYILDLHGNSNKGETPALGSSADENVFNIKQGVAIGLFVKTGIRQNGSLAKIHRADFYGSRAEKLTLLRNSDHSSTKWKTLAPKAPGYLFEETDDSGLDLQYEFNSGWQLTEIFPLSNVGVVTARDSLAIHFTKQDLKSAVTRFASLPPDKARKEFALGPDARDWKVSFAQDDLKSSGLKERRIVPILYRPFDVRYTYFTGRSRGFHCMPRGETMKHMTTPGNLALIATKQTKDEWQIGVTSTIMGHKSIAAYDINSLFPLFLTNEDGSRSVNFSGQFIEALRRSTGLHYSETDTDTDTDAVTNTVFSPLDIFHYITAMLSAPAYKSRYASLLKRDFARIPLPSSAALFKEMAVHGEKVARCFLMKELSQIRFPVKGSNEVTKPRFECGRIWINETQYFEAPSPSVWSRKVGGYLPAQRWLKDRRGRKLSRHEIGHYQSLLSSLNTLEKLTPEIDSTLAKHGFWEQFSESKPKAA